MNIGSPAPEPINTASKPSSSSSSSIVTDLPTDNVGLDLYAERFYIFYFLCNDIRPSEDGTPEYRIPARRLLCAVPRKLLHHSQALPDLLHRSVLDGPEPMTATFLPFFSAGAAGLMPCSLAQSATKRSSLPMDTGSPLMPRIHFPSHWLSCGTYTSADCRKCAGLAEITS